MTWGGKGIRLKLGVLALSVASAIAPAAAQTAGEPPRLRIDLGQGRLEQPHEVFYSELSGGRRPPLSVLGDLLFSSPYLFGGAAAREALSCQSCHVQGAGNPRLFVPGHSIRPGTFDTTGPLFNPRADNHILDAVTPPSLRGTKFLAPYTHEGRMPTLREFTRNAIVNEFAGPEPSPVVLDALVAYMQDIAFVANPRLTSDGRLAAGAAPAEKRGEALFKRPFASDPSLSCASCHVPSGSFVDHQQHDVGAGGSYKTPTLRNANFNAPYFHDGRFETYAEVVAYFDAWFTLGLTPADQSDLVAYLKAAGDAEQGLEPVTAGNRLAEITTFSEALGTPLADHDWPTFSLAVDSLVQEVRELQEFYPEAKDPTIEGGTRQRAAVRNALAAIIFDLRRTGQAAETGDGSAAQRALAQVPVSIAAATTAASDANAWSLFEPANMARHMEALKQYQAANGG